MEVLGVTLLVFLGIILFIGGVILYFLPTILAYKKKHRSKVVILIINIFFGWSLIGWVACLLWVLLDNDGSRTSNILRNVGGNRYEDLAKLQQLREHGTITEAEFEEQKAKLLK